jgi:hypothetical protein
MSRAGGKCGGEEKCIQSLVEKLEGKRTLGGPTLCEKINLLQPTGYVMHHQV